VGHRHKEEVIFKEFNSVPLCLCES
jgi:hypothetical protein